MQDVMQSTKDQKVLKNSDNWVFDLDNTLYPHTSNLFLQVDKKMTDFIMQILSSNFDTAYALQKEYYRNYGTTLSGLIKHHAVNPNDYMEYVHNIDYTPIQKCDVLTDVISSMSSNKYVFTNGTKSHAVKVLDRLGLTDTFDGLFGVEDCDFIPKPHAHPYDIFIDKFNIDSTKSVFVEDVAINLKVPKQKGFATVYIETPCMYASLEQNAKYIDYKTTGLSVFLSGVFF